MCELFVFEVLLEAFKINALIIGLIRELLCMIKQHGPPRPDPFKVTSFLMDPLV